MYFTAIVEVPSFFLLHYVFLGFSGVFVFFPPSCAAPQSDFPATLAWFPVLSSFPALLFLYSSPFPFFHLSPPLCHPFIGLVYT